MTLIPPALRARLVANACATIRQPRHDPAPVLKLVSPISAATWLATELLPDGDTLFGLADLGFGCPEFGYVSLAMLTALHLPFGLSIERDAQFTTTVPLSLWADLARAYGSIRAAEAVLALDCLPVAHPLPPDDTGG